MFVIKFKNKKDGRIGYYDGNSDYPIESQHYAHHFHTYREAMAVAKFDLYDFDTTVVPYPARKSSEKPTEGQIIACLVISLGAFWIGAIFGVAVAAQKLIEQIAC